MRFATRLCKPKDECEHSVNHGKRKLNAPHEIRCTPPIR